MAFTLVELIVVITILAILATVAFVSFQGYTQDSRDTVRINNLSLIDRWLNIQLSQWNKLPKPHNSIDIYLSGSLYGYQWDFTPQVWATFWITDDIIDPVDKQYFSYSTNAQFSQYSVSSELESSSYAHNNIFTNIYAQEDNIKVVWWDIWIIYKQDQPIHRDSVIQTNWNVDISEVTEVISSYFLNNSQITDTGEKLSQIYNVKLLDQDLLSQDTNGIAYFDFTESINDKFQNYTIENTSNIALTQDGNKNVLQCSATYPMQIWVGQNLLWWRNEFAVFVKYKVERWDNNSYNIIYASQSSTGEYNFKAQHNFTDLDNPTLQISTQDLDNWDVMWGSNYVIPISYGKYHSFLFTSKNGEWSIIFDGKKVESGTTQWNIKNHSSSTGMWLCWRFNGSYALNWLIEKYYLSKSWVNHQWAMALYNLLNQ